MLSNDEKRGILQERLNIFNKAMTEYDTAMTEFCRQQTLKYFHPFQLDLVSYLPEHIDITDLYTEDGELNGDALEGLTYQSALVPHSANPDGFFMCVDRLGKVSERKISSNIIHTDRLSFNEPPGPTVFGYADAYYYQKFYPDNTSHKYVIYVPPGVPMEPIVNVPIRPIHWRDAAKELGVSDPWNYGV